MTTLDLLLENVLVIKVDSKVVAILQYNDIKDITNELISKAIKDAESNKS